MDLDVVMLRALLNGVKFPPNDVPDTPENRKRWSELRRDLSRMPPGAIPDVPAEWAG